MENMKNMLKGVCLLTVNDDQFVDLFEDTVCVAVVHDGSGYVPGAAIAISDRSEYKALEAAFECLEDHLMGQMTSEEQDERYETLEKEGYDADDRNV